MDDLPDNETRRRILDVAESLFSRRGYAAVKLRDIGAAVGMKHASLYYYAPEGKEGLYVEVMERSFRRHREGLSESIAGAGDDLRDQIHAVARWIVSQPPLDLSRMVHADMPALQPEHAARLMQAAFDALRIPIAEALRRAADVNINDPDLAALALVSVLQSVHNIPSYYPDAVRQQVGKEVADMMLYGWLKR
jgi:AcrR family transcriptional regulator